VSVFHVVRVGSGSTGVPSKVGSLSVQMLGQGLLEWMQGRDSLVLIAWMSDGPVGLCAIEYVDAQAFLRELARPLSSDVVEGRLAVVRCCAALSALSDLGIESAMLESALARLAGDGFTAVFAQVVLPSGETADMVFAQAKFTSVAELDGGDGARKTWLLYRKLAHAA